MFQHRPFRARIASLSHLAVVSVERICSSAIADDPAVGGLFEAQMRLEAHRSN
jgi:hypothetical protein